MRWRRSRILVAVAVVLVTAVGPVAAQCGWRSGFNLPGATSTVWGLFTLDSGSGNELWVAGRFEGVGGIPADALAAFDGLQWRDGGVTGGLSPRVLAVFDNGGGPVLYMGTSGSLRRWDGASWVEVVGFGGAEVRAMTVLDTGGGPELCVGGVFAEVDGTTVNNIACGDGAVWHALTGPSATGVSGAINAMAVYNDGSGPVLYVGGELTEAGGIIASNIAGWDGSAWSAVSTAWGIGVAGAVRTLDVSSVGGSEELIIGGDFEVNANGTITDDIASWDGSAWTAFGTGTDGSVNAVATVGGTLYVGGAFNQAGSVSVSNLAAWDGGTWSTAGGVGILGASVQALAAYDLGSGEQLIVGGSFTRAGSVATSNLLTFDGISWAPLVQGLGVDQGGTVMVINRKSEGAGAGLYVGGHFDRVGSEVIRGVARLDGEGWHALGSGIDGRSFTLTLWDDGGGSAMFVGGDFDTAGGSTANSLARWDGTAWQTLSGPSGVGVDGQVNDAAVYDSGGGEALLVVGGFTQAGGVSANQAASWNGTAFSALNGPSGNGLQGGTPRAAAVFDDGGGALLYVAGGFDTAGGLPAQKIASWDGSAWTTIPGVQDSGQIYDLAVYDDGSGPALYAAGSFTIVGGQSIAGIARWDGTAWSAVGTGGPGSSRHLEPTTLSDGQTALLATSGVDIMAWDGAAWSAFQANLVDGVGTGDGWIETLFNDHTFAGDSLYVGGHFTLAAGLPSSDIAVMDCFESLLADGFESGDMSMWTTP